MIHRALVTACGDASSNADSRIADMLDWISFTNPCASGSLETSAASAIDSSWPRSPKTQATSLVRRDSGMEVCLDIALTAGVAIQEESGSHTPDTKTSPETLIQEAEFGH